MRLWMVSLLIFAIALAGCGRAVEPGQPLPNVDQFPTSGAGLTEVVRTVVPSDSQSGQDYPVEEPTPELGYPPAAEDQATATAYPALEEGAVQASGDHPGQLFQDCARTPGLKGCVEQPGELAGQLAISDRAAGRLIGLDLGSGAGWQAPAQPGELAWSPDGSKLLLVHRTEGGAQSELWSAEGQPLSEPGFDLPVGWQPDGTLTPLDTVRSAQGDQARLERSPEGSWILHVQPAGGMGSSFPLSPQLADQIFVPRDWIPGEMKILAERSFASGAALQAGGELVTIDAQSGQVEELGASAAGSLAWNPAQPGLLAFLAASGGPARERGGERLALFDFASRQLHDPLPVGLQVSGLAWSPDGGQLAFAAEMVGDLEPSEAEGTFDGPGIFLLDPQTGEVERATHPPPGTLDGWPNWTAGGQLIFARLVGRTAAEVRARWLDQGIEIVLFNEAPVVETLPGVPDWPATLAFTPR